MEVQFDRINLFYKNIFLETLKLPQAHKLGDVKFDNSFIHEYKLSFPNAQDLSIINYNIILGESGCGKSTFMNILGGLDNDYTGSVVYDGQFFKDYSEKQLDDWRKHKVGLIFQNYNLISHMTVAENIEIAMTMTRQSKAKRQKRVDSLLKKMGLDGMEGKLPNQLSGGQRQRVAIARAIAGLAAIRKLKKLDIE